MSVDKPENPMKAKKPRQWISADLGELKADWLAYCKRNKTKPSKALKEVIRHLVGKGVGKGATYTVVPDSEEPRSERRRMVIRWTPSELKAIEDEAEGLSSSSAWVIDLVRARLTKQPQFGMKEVDALWESSGQLMKIGTNLNQIARAININPLEADLIRIEMIEELRKEIREHTAIVSDLIQANLKRWEIKK